MRPPLPRLHAITDERVARRPDLTSVAGQIATGGGENLAFHARGHALSGLEHHELAVQLSAFPPVRLFVNDRLDVALACDAVGVQLGASSLAPADARRLGAQWWIGRSVHDLVEANAARIAGADYLVLGPVYATASHPGRTPVSSKVLDKVVALGLPVIAIGGVEPDRVAPLAAAGVYGVAAIRALWDAARPDVASRLLLQELTQ